VRYRDRAGGSGVLPILEEIMTSTAANRHAPCGRQMYCITSVVFTRMEVVVVPEG
jgi:hypothetical protein